MVREIDVSEAQAHFFEILDAVEAGESVTILKRGKPVAILSPTSSRMEQRGTAAAELDKIRKSVGKMVSSEEIIAIRDEGRKNDQ